jgi:hypothetical protein
MARGARREIGGHDLVAASDQGADQVVTDLAAGSGEEDLHEAPIIDRASSAGKPGIGSEDVVEVDVVRELAGRQLLGADGRGSEGGRGHRERGWDPHDDRAATGCARPSTRPRSDRIARSRHATIVPAMTAHARLAALAARIEADPAALAEAREEGDALAEAPEISGGDAALRWRIAVVRAVIAAPPDGDAVRELYGELVDRYRDQPARLAQLRPLGDEIRRLEADGTLARSLVARSYRKPSRPQGR